MNKNNKIIIILFFLLGITIFTTPAHSAPDWYGVNWKYRRAITIDNTGNSNDLTNYQVKVELTPDNFDYSRASSTGADIRFTDSDGTTLIDYWIEEWDDTATSTIWVEVRSIPASSAKTIYMYYGSSAVSTTSNGDDTFEIFEDFSDATFEDFISAPITQSLVKKTGDFGGVILPNGDILMAATSGSNINILRSTDNGATLTDEGAVMVGGWPSIDNDGNNVYVASGDFGTPKSVNFKKSTDGGNTFEPQVPICSSATATYLIDTSVLKLANGDLLVFLTEIVGGVNVQRGTYTVYCYKSTDGGGDLG